MTQFTLTLWWVLKAGESGMVIHSQVAHFTHLVSGAFCCSSTVYPVFMGKMSTLVNFPLTHCEDHTFLDHAVRTLTKVWKVYFH